MNTEIKEQIKAIYPKVKSLAGTLREARVYEKNYRKELKKDPVFAREMHELQRRYFKKGRAPEIRNDDTEIMISFILAYPKYKQVRPTLDAIGIKCTRYDSLRDRFPEFKDEVERLKKETTRQKHERMRLNNNMAIKVVPSPNLKEYLPLYTYPMRME